MPVGSVRMLSPYTEFLLFSSKNSKLRRISQSWHYWHFGLHHSLFAATGYSVYIASLDPVAASGSLPLKTHHPPAWQANMSPDIAKCLPLIKKHCYRAPVENRKTLILCTPWTVASRLLCPGASPGKNTGVGCYFLLQGIASNQGSNPCL